MMARTQCQLIDPARVSNFPHWMTIRYAVYHDGVLVAALMTVIGLATIHQDESTQEYAELGTICTVRRS